MRRVCFCLGLLALIGCSGKTEPRRVEVQGSVIVGETLVPTATVRFLPEPGNSGPTATTSVIAGLYSFTKLDGPYPGRYKVIVNLELSSFPKTATENPDAPPPPTVWEETVTVPDEEKVTLHFIWKSEAEQKAESSDKATTSTTPAQTLPKP